ncbi:MAG: ATP-binding cassette domain-containing protein [Acholeplasmataceae bacterium]|jgi:putative ABC transport system permease protein
MLKVKDLKKTFTVGDFVTNAVDGISIEFRQAEFVAILGPSGCGKTTFLNILGALDRPDSGEISLYGNSLTDFKNIELDRYRNHSLGFIFQTHNLIPHLSIIENVEMGMTLSGVDSKSRRKRALELLEKVGLSEHLHKKPNQLSVGQSQRIAIARALANNPDIILADEPTGSVDKKTSHQIMELIKEVAKDKLVIMVTHDIELAEEYATRIVRLDDGKMVSDSNPYDSDEQEEISKELVLKKTAMSLKTSFISALKNLKTKIGRALLTAFASSIGIVGIALILALSTGMNEEIDTFQSDTLGNYPIIISSTSINYEKLLELGSQKLERFPKEKEVIAYDSNIMAMITRPNVITEEYVTRLKNYHDNIAPEKFSGLTIKPRMSYTILTPVVDGNGNTTYIQYYRDNSSMTSQVDQFTRRSTLIPDGPVFDEVYNYIDGEKPKADPANKTFDIVITVDQYNRINLNILKLLGFDKKDKDRIPFDEFIGKELLYHPGPYNASTFNPDNAIKLRISGIVRVKKAISFALFNSGIGFTSDLVEYVREHYPETLTSIDYINIYAADFDAKEDIKNFLDEYNKPYPEGHPDIVVYADDSAVFSTISKTIIDAITIGLIAFTSISLVVSSIMIAVITYTSVIERTKEIGLMRALGARKKDVSRTFNSENIIIGLIAGIFGIFITYLLTIPLNAIIEHFSQIPDISKVKPLHALIMIGISIFLAFVAGLIPARMAANKDPVEALRIE